MSKTSPPELEPKPSSEPAIPESVPNGQLGTTGTTVDALEKSYRNLPIDRSFWREFWKYAVSISILLLGCGLAYGLSLLKDKPKGQNSKELDQMVGTMEAAAYSGALEMTVSGTVVPFREIRVAAEISGNVTKKYGAFEAGNFVKQGERLLEIDPTDYQLQLETRMAEVEQSEKMLDEAREEILGAQRNIKLAKNDYRLAQSEYQRNERIRNALSSAEIDQSKRALLNAESALMARTNALEMLRAKLKRLNAALALSKANMNRAKLNMKKTTIVAPDDGVIVKEMVQKGDYVRAGDHMITFEDTSRSEVICNLTPTDLDWVRDNAPASAEFDQDAESFSAYYLPKTRVSVFEPAEPEVVWDGILERFDGIGRDETTRSIPCRIVIDKPIFESNSKKRALVRGMYVKCKIQVQTSAKSDEPGFIYIPSVALRPGDVVWVVQDHKLKQVPVEVVHYTERLIGEELKKIVVVREQEGSLKSGDMIVTTPLAAPRNGLDVILEHEFRASEIVKEKSAED